jgi:hypothetical protein
MSRAQSFSNVFRGAALSRSIAATFSFRKTLLYNTLLSYEIFPPDEIVVISNRM